MAQMQTCDYWTTSKTMSKDNVTLKEVAPNTCAQLLVLQPPYNNVISSILVL